MGWACGAYGWGEGIYSVLVGKPEGKRPLRRPRRRWVDNIKMDIQEVGCGYMDWTGLAQDRDRGRTLVSAVMNLRVPWNAANFLTSCKPLSCSRRTLHHGVSKWLLLSSHITLDLQSSLCPSYFHTKATYGMYFHSSSYHLAVSSSFLLLPPSQVAISSPIPDTLSPTVVCSSTHSYLLYLYMSLLTVTVNLDSCRDL